MDDTAFDHALVAAAFGQAAERGWSRLNIADAARAADLPLDQARARFASRADVLLRFGVLADQAALAGAAADGATRDRLFDTVMRRVDFLQAHRPGVIALLRWLPGNPVVAAILGAMSLRSMAWLLEAAGASPHGPAGLLRAQGLLAVWVWVVRAWRSDNNDDLSATMAALDRALDRAEQAERSLSGLFSKAITPPAPFMPEAAAAPYLPPEPTLAAPEPEPPPFPIGDSHAE